MSFQIFLGGVKINCSGGVKMKNIIRLKTGTNLFSPVHFRYDEDDEGSPWWKGLGVDGEEEKEKDAQW